MISELLGLGVCDLAPGIDRGYKGSVPVPFIRLFGLPLY
jgi:hypothetical protein